MDDIERIERKVDLLYKLRLSESYEDLTQFERNNEYKLLFNLSTTEEKLEDKIKELGLPSIKNVKECLNKIKGS